MSHCVNLSGFDRHPHSRSIFCFVLLYDLDEVQMMVEHDKFGVQIPNASISLNIPIPIQFNDNLFS